MAASVMSADQRAEFEGEIAALSEAAARPGLLALERQCDDLRDSMDCGDLSDGQGFRLMEELHGLEREIRSAPILSRSDAAVKMRSLLHMFEREGRADGSDEATMIQVTRWLERALVGGGGVKRTV